MLPQAQVNPVSAPQEKRQNFKARPVSAKTAVKEVVQQAHNEQTNVIKWPQTPVEKVTEQDQEALQSVFDQLSQYPDTKQEALTYIRTQAPLTNDGRAFGDEYIELNY
jgi:hypothetical protein